ncbi:Exported protein [Nitrospira japonica]|uniref:Exported protein n=1 Tax=Nitrospira japonica TaxID=1325564 RepID=A0A1W1I1T8_9BACT|nr:hypothetical protein [Nitrospira japonica]SLM46976.1 Exported protein [Nitrospira japonica]
MRPRDVYRVVATLAMIWTAMPALSNASEQADVDLGTMWSCPLPDGTVLYTNKDRKNKDGCTPMSLKPLSVVPSLDAMPTYRPPVASAPQYDIPAIDRGAGPSGSAAAPDWAKDWHASVTSSGSVQAEVCSIYSEWLQLNQKSRGGFYFGSDPSYGGDVSAQNQRGPSYSFYDNARYHTLARIFGTGFVPVGCL